VRVRFDVCVLGSVNADLVVRAPRLPGAGETLLGGPFERYPGGKGANQAVAAARMGARTAMIGAVGGDENGRELARVLRAERVDVSHVVSRAEVATGVALITVAASGDNSIVVAPGANATLAPADVEAARELVESSRTLVAQLEVPLETVARAFEIARSSGVRTILNAAPARELPPALLASTDVLIVNEGESRALVRTAGLRDRGLALAIASLGPAAAVLTLADRGAWLAKRAEARFQPAFQVAAIDTTGAGDAFVGAFAQALARGAEPEQALERACAAGALACTVRGAIPAMPTAEAVDALVNRST
jgi:ribokinase